MIRNLEQRDLDQVKAIHEKYYKDEFPFPDLNDFIGYCVGVDSDDNVIALGGVRNIAEIIFITDKDQPTIKRVKVLKELMTFGSYITARSGKNQLYAHAEGADWIRNIKKAGFRQFKAVPLVLDLD